VLGDLRLPCFHFRVECLHEAESLHERGPRRLTISRLDLLPHFNLLLSFDIFEDVPAYRVEVAPLISLLIDVRLHYRLLHLPDRVVLEVGLTRLIHFYLNFAAHAVWSCTATLARHASQLILLGFWVHYYVPDTFLYFFLEQ
jgi:hypothetical protein